VVNPNRHEDPESPDSTPLSRFIDDIAFTLPNKFGEFVGAFAGFAILAASLGAIRFSLFMAAAGGFGSLIWASEVGSYRGARDGLVTAAFGILVLGVTLLISWLIWRQLYATGAA